jgi:long-subunit acyl-CoA synthetase (AMP-forming)
VSVELGEASVASGTLLAHLRGRAERTPDGVALRHKELGIWREVRWTGYLEAVLDVARGLLALGLAPGDRVAVLAEACPEWAYLDLGAIAARALTLGLHPGGPPEETAALLAGAGARVLVADDPGEVDAVLGSGTAGPERVVLVGDRPLEGEGQARLRWADLLEMGRTHRAEHPGALDALDPPALDEVIALTLTAGASEPPRVVELTMARVEAALAELTAHGALASPPPGPEDEIFAAVTPAVAHQRLGTTWLGLATGCPVSFPESAATVDEDLREVQPSLIVWPRRAWARQRAEVLAGLEGPSRLKRAALGAGLRLGGADLGSPGMAWPVTAPIRRRLGLARCRGALAVGLEDAGLAAFFRRLGVSLRAWPSLVEEPRGPWAELERRLAAAAVVREAVVRGERGSLEALVAVEDELVGEWARRRGVVALSHRELVEAPEVAAMVVDAVRKADVADEVATVRLLADPLDQTRGDVTPTGELRRWCLREHRQDPRTGPDA